MKHLLIVALFLGSALPLNVWAIAPDCGFTVGKKVGEDFKNVVSDPAFLEKEGKVAIRFKPGTPNVQADKEVLAYVATLKKMVTDASSTTPDVWFYPASGYDLATLVAMLPDAKTRAKTFILVTNTSPFVELKDGKAPPEIVFERETDENSQSWGLNAEKFQTVAEKVKSSGGMLPNILARMARYFGEKNFRVHEAQYYEGKSYVHPTQQRLFDMGITKELIQQHEVHGTMTFDLGPGTPTHRLIYIDGSVTPDVAAIRVGADHEIKFDDHGIFNSIGGVFVKASHGILAPPRFESSRNKTREYMLSALARNNGMLVEGMMQTRQQNVEPEPVWEVTSDLQESGATPNDANRLVRIAKETTHDFKLSYFPGIRISLWSKTK